MIRKLNKKEIAFHEYWKNVHEKRIEALREKENFYGISCAKDIKRAENSIKVHKGILKVGVKIVERKGKKYECNY